MKTCKKFIGRLLTFLIMVFVVISCSNPLSVSSEGSSSKNGKESEENQGNNGTVLVTSVTVTKENPDAALTEDGTIKLVATVLPENATNKKVKWTSSDQSVAVVNSSGLVTALKTGSVTIKAISDENAEKFGSITLDITAKAYQAKGELEYELSADGTYYSLKGIGTYDGSIIDIPAMYKSLPVKEIVSYAFDNNLKITSVTIPESIEKIGKYAFRDCNSLTKINYNAVNCENFTYEAPFTLTSASTSSRTCIIGNKVQKLPDYLFFSGTSNITSIIYEDNSSLKTIGTYVVYANNIITEIVIPESVESVKKYAFYALTAVESIRCNSDSVLLEEDWFGNINYGYGYSTTKGGPVAYYTGKNCHTIPQYFAGHSRNPKEIKSVTCEGEITKICDHAFEKAVFKGDYNLPSTVLEIGDKAFYNATFPDTSRITIPEGIKIIGENAFYDVQNLAESIVLPNIESLKGAAFARTNIKSIDFGDKLTSISSSVVAGTPIESVRIGTSVTEIYYSAFNACPDIKTFKLCGNVEDPKDNNSSSRPNSKYQLFNCSEGQYSKNINVIIGSSVTKIPEYLFYRNPDQEGRIGSITFEASQNGGESSLTIGKYAFYGQNHFSNLVLPAKVELVNEYSFANTAVSDKLEINAKTVKENAFYASSVEKIEIGKSAENIYLNNLTSLKTFYYNAKNASCKGKELGTADSKFEITIGEDVECIKEDFLYGNEVYVSEVGFVQNSKLQTIEFGFLAGNNTSISQLILPESLVEANIRYLKGLNYLYVGPNVKSIYATVKETVNGKTPFIDFNAEEMEDSTSSIMQAIFTCSSATRIRIGKAVKHIPSEFLYKSTADIVYFEEGGICSKFNTEAFREAEVNILEIPLSISKVANDAFSYTKIQNVYSGGSSYSALSGITNWDSFFNSNINNANKYYYNATNQNGYWHYGEDGVPVLW